MSRRRKTLLLLPVSILIISIVTAIGLSVAQRDAPPLPDVPEKNIAYLVVPDRASSLVAAEKLQRALEATTVSSWDAFVQFNQTRPVDALIIHESALPMVDRSWVSNAYRQGVVIGGFNITGSQMADLVGNPCIAGEDFAAYTPNIPNYIIVSFSASGDNPAEVDQAVQRHFRICSGEPPLGTITGHVGIGSHRSTDALTDENYFNQFTQVLATHFDDWSPDVGKD